jgi:hypothetical protein
MLRVKGQNNILSRMRLHGINLVQVKCMLKYLTYLKNNKATHEWVFLIACLLSLVPQLLINPFFLSLIMA